MTKTEATLKKELQALDDLFQKSHQLLIIVHNNPDPDAIATAIALQHLVKRQFNINSDIAYGGNIGRAENRAMVQKLKIRMKQINRISMDKYDRFALVDTQPGSGNNSFPENKKCHLVIDHHPKLRKAKADIFILEPEIGVSATILIEWLNAGNIEIPADLATALSYAIISETQNLGRETINRDIQAYLSVYTKSSIRKLAEIINPKLPRSYFVTLAKALTSTFTYKHLIYSNLGDVSNAEIVAEIADFLLRHERVSWSLCIGRFKDKLIISVRSSNPKARAGKLVKRLTSNSNTVGGHDMIAGGFIPLSSQSKKELENLDTTLIKNFARQTGNQEADWKPLLDISNLK
jgi:nanoRNase/pAp phosphatase (c-di-AMP/oligoRNAs hydrolase)